MKSTSAVKIVWKDIQSCENNGDVTEMHAMAASSVLNAMSNGLISVRIPDQRAVGGEVKVAKTYTESDFKKCVKLKEKAMAILDQFDVTKQKFSVAQQKNVLSKASVFS